MAKRLPLLLLVAAAAAGGVAWFGFRAGGWWAEEAAPEARGAQVRRGPLHISVVQRGALEARNSVAVKSEIEGRATILYLIGEGTLVKAGDLVCELDSSELTDRRVAQEITVQNNQAGLIKARQVLEIQKSQNESDVAGAQQNLEFAQADLKKYVEGDWPQQLQEREEAIVLAREELAQANDRLEWSARLEEQGFLTRTELESDQLAHERAKITLEQTERAKKLLIDYDHPRQLATLEAAVTEAQRELDRVKLQADARLIDYQSDVASAEATLQLEQEKLAKLIDQLQKTKLYAPQDGMVIHARQEDRMGSNQPIEEGAQVFERQEIMSIPQSTGMVAEAKLHETVLKQVRPGQSCTIRVDAIPGQEFQGMVESVAALPDKSSWWANPDQKLFKTTIPLTGGVPEMRPGMSCEVEIHITTIEDTLYVPLQAVYYNRGETICFVLDGERTESRGVQIGMSSPQWAEVQAGLALGETVLLSPPLGVKLEPAPQEENPAGPPNGERAGGPPARGRDAGANPPAGNWRPGGRPTGPPAGASGTGSSSQ